MTNHEPFGSTKNGIPVYVYPQRTHTASHFADNPGLVELARVTVAKVTATAENIQVAYDWGRPVGLSDLVSTTVSDEIVYAKRQGRQTYTRFVKHRPPAETAYVTVVLQKISRGYLLISAWIGPSVPPFPGDRREWPDSRAFWEQHALLFGRQQIDEATLRTDCPW